MYPYIVILGRVVGAKVDFFLIRVGRDDDVPVIAKSSSIPTRVPTSHTTRTPTSYHHARAHIKIYYTHTHPHANALS